MGKDLCKTHDTWTHTWSRAEAPGLWGPRPPCEDPYFSGCLEGIWRVRACLEPWVGRAGGGKNARRATLWRDPAWTVLSAEA